MGAERVISVPINREYYWLSNLVNKFHYHGGLEMITDTICLPKTNLAVSLLACFGVVCYQLDVDAILYGITCTGLNTVR